MFLPHIPAVIGTISSTAVAAAQPPLYLGSVSSSGAGPFDFNSFDTGLIYPGRQLLFIVAASKDWNNSGPPGLSFSVNGGSALTPISTVSGNSGGLFSVGRTFSAFIVSNEDATVDFDCTSTQTVAIFRVFVYSLVGELTLTDTATGIGNSSTNNTYTTPLSPGAALIGFAMARVNSGPGGLTTASIHSPGGAGSTTYSWSVASVSPPNAITWTNITEDDQYGGIGNTNHGGGLWLLFEKA